MIDRSRDRHRSSLFEDPDPEPSGDGSAPADPREETVGCDTDGDAASLRVDPACPSLQLARTSIKGTSIACRTARLRVLAMVKFEDATPVGSMKYASPCVQRNPHKRSVTIEVLTAAAHDVGRLEEPGYPQN